MTSERDTGDGEWVDAPRPFLDRPPVSPDPRVAPAGGDDGPDDPGTVRPYLLTGGRTSSRPDVNVETIVTLTGSPSARPLVDEHLILLRLAQEPMAVAELAAYMGVPLGVALVLAGDLAEAGVVRLNGASASGSDSPADDVMLIRKVVNGVLKLRNAETI